MIKHAKEAMKYDGDIVEIGLGYGETTKKLLQLAKDNDKKVIGIDPFEEGWDSMPKSYYYPYGKFVDNIGDLSEYLELHKESSQGKDASKILRGRNICLAYIDGLQFKEAVLNDLNLCSRAKVIIVDDMNRETGESQVPKAVAEYIKKSKRELTIEGRWAVIK